jgi:hypothetical protein
VTTNRERLQQSAERPLSLVLVDPDNEKLQRIQNAFEVVGGEDGLPGLKFVVTPFIGTNVAISRQFLSLRSPPPSSVPPLNQTLNVLMAHRKHSRTSILNPMSL